MERRALVRVINELRGSVRYAKGLTGDRHVWGWWRVLAASKWSHKCWETLLLPPILRRTLLLLQPMCWLPFPPQTANLLPVYSCIKCKEKSITRVVYCIAYETVTDTSENRKWNIQIPVRTGNLMHLFTKWKQMSVVDFQSYRKWIYRQLNVSDTHNSRRLTVIGGTCNLLMWDVQ